jgi:hypothetical protein
MRMHCNTAVGQANFFALLANPEAEVSAVYA